MEKLRFAFPSSRKPRPPYHRVPTVLQMEYTECGAASLAMILAGFGQYIPLEQLRVETGVSRDGSSAASLRRCAKAHGLECKAKSRDAEQLCRLSMPCILHWGNEHFLVLQGFKGRWAILNDPACGRRRVTMEELKQSFSGVVLTFSPTPDFKKQKQTGHTIPFLRSRLTGFGPVWRKLGFIGLLMVLPGLLLPVLSQVFIDDILISGYSDWLVRLLLFMIFSILLKQGLDVYRGCILARFKASLTLISGRDLLRRLFHLPMTFFYQRRPADLVSRMGQNEQISDFLAGSLGQALLDMFIVVFYLVILCIYSLPLTLLGLFAASLTPLCAMLSARRSAADNMKLQISEANLYGAVCGGASISQTIKASGAQIAYSNRVLGFHAQQATQEQRVLRSRKLTTFLPQTLGAVSRVLMLVLGALLAIRGSFTAGMLVAFQSLYESFRAPVDELVDFMGSLQTLRSDIQRVDDVNRCPPQPDPVPDEQALARLKSKLSGRLQLEDVTYGYTPSYTQSAGDKQVSVTPPVVSQINLSLTSGSSLALVGASGCGKSTLARIIGGLYTPWSGRVLYDDVPLQNLPARILHASVATVSQQITLFSGTIRQNLTLWNHALPDADMIAAARDACIHDDIIRLPGGYNCLLQEGGANLSGGQRQRLQIARALAANPSVLIMDEATSALDPPTEKQVMDNIRRRGCTMIIVAHRLSTVRDCSQIAVMSGGAIVQQGTHEQLLRQDGPYRTLCLQDSAPGREEDQDG